jgi:quercetin dioxygenase-like cupin family protein
MRNALVRLTLGIAVVFIVWNQRAAVVAADAIQQPNKSAAAQVQYFPAVDVNKAFASNATLVDGKDRNYSIIAGKRDKAGEVEVHATNTDVIYITGGSATFVTGGRVIEPRTTAPGETRGREIEGGNSHQLSKGDVIVVPAGVPHWFKAVQPPLNDFIVKVRQENR